jgi:GrpB-like predicted nucleotidyltransferase (UPF0157 family)
MLGLKLNVNYLVDYDPLWPAAFGEERARIQAALGPLAKGIEHQGSTSVPGMRAKPILDILVGVHPIEDWALCRAPLEALGYDYVENAGIPRHHIFGRGRDASERTHLLHIVDIETDEWRGNLAFRDALRSDPELRRRYVAEKERAAAAAPEGRARYTAIKGPFIQSVKAGFSAPTLHAPELAPQPPG